VEEVFSRFAIIARLKDVIMKMVAATAVILLRNVLAPRAPKTVWLEPPNAAPISAPFPDWRRITPTIVKATRTCRIISAVYIGPYLRRKTCSMRRLFLIPSQAGKNGCW
jgi:hypothetical protein